jgi:hypothetical protein
MEFFRQLDDFGFVLLPDLMDAGLLSRLKQLLDADLQAALSPELRELLALDDPLNDDLSGQDVKRSGFLI